jgi:lipopolysaccharide transport system ATP-binding protein
MTRAIAASALSKRYVISHVTGPAYLTLTDSIAGTLRSFGRRAPDAAPQKEEFWALRDVGFEVRVGERLGVIGRNGAGKSTLLKVLSRITEPTTGRVEIRGRVASLLEVGTGFHPELTGRENIFLNGVILGMTRAEVRRKFDEIVAFAEVDKFLDTPVKRFSTGMYLRLAFAVAAHLDPDVLIVDEVLAVGDAAFQKKCLGKLEEVGRSGRTVLFVSHNMGAIDAVCDTAILLEAGRIVARGNAKDVTSQYLRQAESAHLTRLAGMQHPHFRFESVSTRLDDGEPAAWIDRDRAFAIEMGFRVSEPVRGVEIGLALMRGETREPLVCTALTDSPEHRDARDFQPGEYAARLLVPAGFLLPGTYYVSLFAHAPFREHYDKRHYVASFEIKRDAGYDVAKYSDSVHGMVALPGTWELERRAAP